MRTGRPERLRGFTYRGFHRYFLTFCTFQRRRRFTDVAAVGVALNQILRVAAREQFAVAAYCFMPDHLHLLVHGMSEDADVRRFIKLAKQCSGHAFSQTQREHLWQRYGYERVLRGDEETLPVARYILENPVRAGLAECPREYPFSGSPAYSVAAVMDAIAWAPARPT